MIKISLPAWKECDERLDDLERSDRTIAMSVMHGFELTPLERVIHRYDDSDPERSKAFLKDVRALVEWCLNNPDQVISSHERLNDE